MKRLVRMAAFVVALATGLARGADVAPSVLVQAYFDSLSRSFEQLVQDRAMTRLELTPANRLFVQSIQLNPSFYSLMRTNSKGVLINEVVRGKGRVKGYRSLTAQRWYGNLHDKLEAYRGTVTDKQSRLYLLWAQPIVILGSRDSRRFGGVAAVKIDLHECFTAVAQLSEYPFRVMAGGTQVFSHRWENGLDFDEATVEVPGLSGVVVQEIRRSPEPAPVATNEYGEAQYAGSGTDETAGSDARPRSWWKLAVRIMLLSCAAILLAMAVNARLRWRHILSQVYRDTPG